MTAHGGGRRSRAARAFTVVVTAWLAATLLAPPAAEAASVTLLGGGSTWSKIAIDQWRVDVAKFGLKVNYAGVGSTSGRQLFIARQVDFAVSELAFLPDELKRNTRPFAYLPIVAGGTSLMYNISIGGHRVNNLHLDSATMTAMFTGVITQWNDPRLVKLNPFLKSYHHQVVPVVRSDGSGTSWQLSSYMRFAQHGMWAAFMSRSHIPDAPVQFWPNFGAAVAQQGSDGVANYVANPATGPGSIGYVEYGYALARRFPVAYVKNRSGHYVYPTSVNDATALRHATFYKDNTQNLTAVYTCPEVNCYPISSYSYMIAPTSTADPFTAEKGAVLGKFIAYFACAGQKSAASLGYSPLPPNLVQNDFDVIRRIPGAPAPPAMKDCPNPTITGQGLGGDPPPPGGSLQGENPPNSSGTTGASTPGAGGTGGTQDTGDVGLDGSLPSPIGIQLSAADLQARQNAVKQAVGGVQSGSSFPLGFIAFDLALLVLAPIALAGYFRRRGATGA
jgi:phosphate transport system substrate-binding protein